MDILEWINKQFENKPVVEDPIDVSLKEFNRRLLRVCLEQPNKKNPTDGNGCFYTSLHDEYDHCLFGEYITQYHSADYLYEGENASEILMHIGYSNPDIVGTDDSLMIKSQAWVDIVQREADNFGNPLPWSEVGLFILNGVDS